MCSLVAGEIARYQLAGSNFSEWCILVIWQVFFLDHDIDLGVVWPITQHVSYEPDLVGPANGYHCGN